MKISKNPWVIHKTKTSFDRECPLSEIPFVIRADGSKGCIWCGDDLKSKHASTRYCKDSECSKSAYKWGYPQGNASLAEILNNQELRCNLCHYDYLVLFLELKPSFDGILDEDIIKKFKKKIPLKYRPEVDHVLAIMSGGQSLGLENHQAICYTCHKTKTKVDIKQVKRKKGSLEIIKIKNKKLVDKYYKNFDIYRKKHNKELKKKKVVDISYKQLMKNFSQIFLLETISINELEFICLFNNELGIDRKDAQYIFKLRQLEK